MSLSTVIVVMKIKVLENMFLQRYELTITKAALSTTTLHEGTLTPKSMEISISWKTTDVNM